jgi:diguanylate cyclase (GGDEF)-like protein
MKKQDNQRIPFTIHDSRVLARPILLAAIACDVCLTIASINQSLLPGQRLQVLLAGGFTVVYILAFYGLLIPVVYHFETSRWVLAGTNGIISGLLIYVYPHNLFFLYSLSTVLLAVVSGIILGRHPTYAYITICTLFQSPLIGLQEDRQFTIIVLVAFLCAIAAIIETIVRMQRTLFTQLKRVDTVNSIAMNLAASLEIHEVIAQLKTAIQTSFTADTYYVGLLTGEVLRLELFYDDGAFYPVTELPIDNTLAGWAIHHRRSLMLKNVPAEQARYGIQNSIIGKPLTSRSWMGTPLVIHDQVLGLIGVASYKIETFNPTDLVLLENIAQQAAIALDNARHHSEVERQSHHDSLTGVYNHGYFIHRLEEAADAAIKSHVELCLIMLDIDHFKLYNDRYGHLAGDQILSMLTENIRRNIHPTDIVGRWGGEEFVIVLPNTNASQAVQVAERIRASMDTLIITRKDQKAFPCPTISQGLAQFPTEESDIFSLIDLADKRLYIAKERGRNHIEVPPIDFLTIVPPSNN